MMKLLLASAFLVACACPAKRAASTAEASSNASVGTPPGDACEAVRPHVEQLYRAEAQTAEPKRVDEATADNTAMVMADCAVAPAKVSACLAASATVPDIERRCLTRLDEAGNPQR